MKAVRTLFIWLLKIPVYLYRWFISPLSNASCRHHPSCSAYMLGSLEKHGPLRGFLLGTNRILRCRRGGTFGYDPVPFLWIRRYRPWQAWLGRWKRSNRLKRYPT